MSDEAKQTTMMVKEEIKPTSESAENERQGPGNLRELDAQIAEKVMGWANVEANCNTPIGKEWCGDDPEGAGGFYRTGRKIIRHYSTDIAAAMQVVEAFIAKGGRVALRGGIAELMEDVPPGYWQAHFYRYLKVCPPGTRFSFTVTAATLPEAICRAALDAALALVDGPSVTEGETSG